MTERSNENEAAVDSEGEGGPQDPETALIPGMDERFEEGVASRRIPNLGHAMLFIAFAGLMLVGFQVLLYLMGKSPMAAQTGHIHIEHPKLQLAALGGTYLSTMLVAWLFFPMLWRRSFLDGVGWNWAAARRQAGKLIPLGLLLGALVAAATYFVSTPKSSPVDDFFRTATDAWLITIFGSVVAPVFEEVCFRGFLLPAFAISYDWLSLPRTPVAQEQWRSTATITPIAYLFSALVSSMLFALMHLEQVAHVWAALGSIFSVSLALSMVRLKTRSVACSAMVHGSYNFFVFLSVLLATGGYRHLDRMSR